MLCSISFLPTPTMLEIGRNSDRYDVREEEMSIYPAKTMNFRRNNDLLNSDDIPWDEAHRNSSTEKSSRRKKR